MKLEELFRTHLNCNESKECLFEFIENFRNDVDDSNYDEDEHICWSNYVDEHWGEDYGYEQVFYEVLENFRKDLEIYDDDIDYLYQIFIDWLLIE